MICTEKERKSCNEEKLGCEGCYYNKPSKEEIEEAKYLKEKEWVLEDCKNDISEEHIKNIFKYIDQLEAENTNLKQIEAEHQKINGELRTKLNKTQEALKLINEYIGKILK